MSGKRGIAGVALVLSAVLLLLGGCDNPAGGPTPRRGHVALYDGTGSLDASVRAAEAVLEEMGVTVTRVSALDVQSGLGDAGLVVIPGGDPGTMAQALGFAGLERIALLVEGGGGFIGLGGGAYLAADSLYLKPFNQGYQGSGLVAGALHGPAQTLPPRSVVTLELENDPLFNPDLVNSLNLLYDNGPSVWNHVRARDGGLRTVGTVSLHGFPGAVVGASGLGRVAMVSVSPEYTNDLLPPNAQVSGASLDAAAGGRWLRALVEWCCRY